MVIQRSVGVLNFQLMRFKLSVFALLPMLFFISACGGPSADQSSTAASDEEAAPMLASEQITYSTDSTDMIGYLTFDESVEGKRPGVLVVHEWWGHNDYARKRADMLAELGYVALAVDMYGDGKLAEHPDDAGKFMMSVIRNFPVAKARFEAAIEALKQNPNVDPERIGAVGYCFGGSVVLSMANTGIEGLDAVASFHGGLTLPVMPEAGKITARVLVANGAEDPFVKEEHITAYTAAMDSAQADYKLINYEGAKHSFTNPEADANGEKFEMPLAYNATADTQSWEELKAMFAEVFGQ